MKQLLFFLILFITNTIQAITGFAGTLLAMPVSILLLGVQEAKVILNIMAFLSCLWIALKECKNIKWKICAKILGWMGIGMGVGIWLFQKISLDFLLPMYGIMILIIAGKNLLVKKTYKVSDWLLIIVLFMAGVIHGMFVSGGALLVVYATTVLKDKKEIRATVASVWVVLNMILMITDYSRGYITADVLKMSCMGVIPLFFALYLGNRIHEKINQDVFLKMTYVLLFISGLTIIF